MSVHQAFLLGTRNGGLALRRPDLGVLREGATADVLVFNMDKISLVGWSDPVAAIVLHSTAADIEDIYVNGTLVKNGGELVVDWRGKGWKKRLEDSAKKWTKILASTNITLWQEEVTAAIGWKNFGVPFQVDVTPGSSNGF